MVLCDLPRSEVATWDGGQVTVSEGGFKVTFDAAAVDALFEALAK